jgi:hypothetical protein
MLARRYVGRGPETLSRTQSPSCRPASKLPPPGDQSVFGPAPATGPYDGTTFVKVASSRWVPPRRNRSPLPSPSRVPCWRQKDDTGPRLLSLSSRREDRRTFPKMFRRCHSSCRARNPRSAGTPCAEHAGRDGASPGGGRRVEPDCLPGIFPGVGAHLRLARSTYGEPPTPSTWSQVGHQGLLRSLGRDYPAEQFPLQKSA